MNEELVVLYITAASIGFFHTIFGPDHYLPFIVMSKARKWSMPKTLFITLVCGIGHIASSVILGLVGIAFGIAVMKLENLEAFRGNIAAWALIGFGLAYFIWGVRKAIRKKPHEHSHIHIGKQGHAHLHTHTGEHTHIHDHNKANITPWVLFTIFILGPCEPLIPILMYPAAKMNLMGVFMVAGVFGIVTISTMLMVVFLASFGIRFVPLGRLEKYGHALAGAAICASGLAIQFLGL